MALGMSVSLRNRRLDAITAEVGTSGLLKFYSGTRPATGATVTSQTLLVSIPCSASFAGAASGGTLTLNPLTPAIAISTGQTTWARLTKADGTFVMDMDVGGTGSGADVILASTLITLLITVGLTSYVITDGNS